MKKNLNEFDLAKLTFNKQELNKIVGGCPGQGNDPDPPPCGP